MRTAVDCHLSGVHCTILLWSECRGWRVATVGSSSQLSEENSPTVLSVRTVTRGLVVMLIGYKSLLWNPSILLNLSDGNVCTVKSRSNGFQGII